LDGGSKERNGMLTNWFDIIKIMQKNPNSLTGLGFFIK
jgi:hypothetical protein